MIILGITGGSGCGKTTVSKILSNHGVDVIDCDTVAKKIVEPNTPALSEIIGYFGYDYLNPDGALNRRKLASLVFNSPEKLLKLNEITHKYIVQYIDLYIKNSRFDIIGIDAAALIESGIYKKCDYVLCVLADYEKRAERIQIRDGISKKEAADRINAQKNDEFYIEKSDFIVYNNSNTKEIEDEILTILNKIRSTN